LILKKREWKDGMKKEKIFGYKQILQALGKLARSREKKFSIQSLLNDSIMKLNVLRR